MIKFNDHFRSHGIDVSYNTLAATQELINSYVADYRQIVLNHPQQISHYVKHECYSTMYDFMRRPKLTGFEPLQRKDRQFRNNISPYVSASAFTPSLVVPSIDRLDLPSYKQQLLKHVASLRNAFVYYSGGLDSELVLNAFIEAKIPFTPVIFYFQNNDGVIINAEELKYAEIFCRENKLSPHIEYLNVEELWNSGDFAKLAINVQCTSPHQVTHMHMVNVIDAKFPNKKHVFGGEVRFYANHTLDNGSDANLVLLAKAIPQPYNGTNYTSVSNTATQASIQLTYSNSGSVTVNRSPQSPSVVFSGTWTTTPGSSYEYQVSSISVITDNGGTHFPTSPTSYAPIGASTVVCGCNSIAGGMLNGKEVTFTVNVRVIGQGAPVASGTVTLWAERDQS